MNYQSKIKFLNFLEDNGWKINEKFKRYELIKDKNYFMSFYLVDSFFENKKGTKWIFEHICNIHNLTIDELNNIIK